MKYGDETVGVANVSGKKKKNDRGHADLKI
jgi:hypothetical protein